MKNTEIVEGRASGKQIDYLKKIRSTLTRKEEVGKTILVILTGIACVGLFTGGGGLLDFPRIPSLGVNISFFCAALLAGNYRFSGGRERAVETGISGAVFVLVVALYSYIILALCRSYQNENAGIVVFPFDRMEPSQIGPLMVNFLRIMALIVAVVLLRNTFGKGKNAYATTLNITAISYIIYANDGLFHMDAPGTFRQWVVELTILQIVLTVVGIAVCILLQKLGKMPAEAEKI